MELVNGEVIVMPPPVTEHTIVAKRIQRFLTEHIGWDRVWPDHTGYRVGPGWLEPDVSVSWAKQQRDDKYFTGSPMVAVEILSPDEDWAEKVDLYLAHGAKEVWIVDHRKKTLRVFETDGRFQRVTCSYASAAGLTITLADIFGA